METFYSQYYKKEVQTISKKRLWEIVSFTFDCVTQKCEGFIYKKSFLRFWFFYIKDARIQDNIFYVDETFDEEVQRYELLGKKVVNQFWQSLGEVEDIEWDLNFKLKSIIVDAWYHMSSLEVIHPWKITIKKQIRKISKNKILQYFDTFILVEERSFLKENKKILENIYKTFINIPKTSYNIK